MRSTSALLACSLLAPALFAQEQLPDAPKEVFVEVPGEMEFTGTMLARPIQFEDAGKYGLTLDQVRVHRDAAQAALGQFEILEYVPETDETIFTVSEGTENQIAGELMAHGDFQYVEPNWEVWPIGCPNDALFNSQWHHKANRMNSCAGWDIWVGEPGTVVAICDTGVRLNHQDIVANRVEGYNAVNQQWENNGGQVNDINGHGTHTTGCAAAIGNNGTGVSGTGQNLSTRMLRVSNSSGGSSTIATLTHAVRTAADVGDKAISVSYSGVTSGGVDSSGAYARGKGALLFWAAGNGGSSISGNRDDNVIIVGSTNQGDGKSGFSNYGPRVDFMAPGDPILSTCNNSNSSYCNASGTSMSCPVAAGLGALVFSLDPSLTPQEVEDFLRAGCDDLGPNGVDNTFGYGRIDVFNTLSLVDTCPVPTTYCVTSPNSAGPGAIIEAWGSQNVDDNDFHLGAGGCPPDKFGIFFYGPNKQQNPVGDGVVCVAGSLFRLPVVKSDSFGWAQFDVDFTNLPNNGDILNGSTWNFQFNYRDPQGGPAGFNFSNAVEVTFCD